jgi:hypothetical protein
MGNTRKEKLDEKALAELRRQKYIAFMEKYSINLDNPSNEWDALIVTTIRSVLDPVSIIQIEDGLYHYLSGFVVVDDAVETRTAYRNIREALFDSCAAFHDLFVYTKSYFEEKWDKIFFIDMLL